MKIAEEIGLVDENGQMHRDRILDCLVRAFNAGRRSALNNQITESQTGSMDRVRELAGIPKKDSDS